MDYSLIIAIVALIIAILSLIYTIKTYWYKNGLDIVGSYSICSSISCDDKYISNIVLENRKDRSVAIYKIYLQIGYNCFVLIDDYSSNPLILNPFEAHVQNFGPVNFYEVNCNRIKIDQLLDNEKFAKRLILSTTDGRYTVKTKRNHWNPIRIIFKNHATAILQPMRLIYKEKSYGSNTQYIIELKTKDNEEIIPIYPGDYKIAKFNHFQLTKEALISKATLAEFLQKEKSNGNLTYDKIIVKDFHEILKEYQLLPPLKNYGELNYLSWFQYYVLARIATLYSDLKLAYHNHKLKHNSQNLK